MESALSEQGWAVRLIARLVRLSCRRFQFVILFCLLLAAVAMGFTARHIQIDTDSEKLFRADVPFRVNQAALDKAFPQRGDLIVVVIDGATPELAESASASLAQRLASQTNLFRSVRRPGSEPFFRQS